MEGSRSRTLSKLLKVPSQIFRRKSTMILCQLAIFIPVLFKNKIIFNFVKVVAKQKGKTTIIFPSLFCCFYCWIRDEWNQDPDPQHCIQQCTELREKPYRSSTSLPVWYSILMVTYCSMVSFIFASSSSRSKHRSHSFFSVLRIRIHRIHMFLDRLVPDPSIIKQK